MSTQPKPTGEWTVEYVIMELGVNTHWKARDIAEAHNAAVAAVLEEYNDEVRAAHVMQQQLAAEKSLRETAQSNAELWHEEMMKADKQLAAEREKVRELKEWKESALMVMPDYQAIGKALGLQLGESVHDKILPAIQKVQPLVGALERIVDMEDVSARTLQGIARDALAKVKEGKPISSRDTTSRA
jgi:hypothetical protein